MPFIFRSKVPIFSRKGQRNVLLLPQLIVTQNSYCKFFEQNILNIQYSVDATIKLNIYYKLDIENPIIRINTAFKGCSSLEKISVLPRIYHN